MNDKDKPMEKPFTTKYTNGSYGQTGSQYPQENSDPNVYLLPESPPMPSHLQYTQQQYIPIRSPYIQKVQIDLFYESEKAKIQAAKEISVSEEKVKIRAAERQSKKAEYDSPFIHPNDGSVCIETKNSIVQSPPIRIANFCSPQILIIHRLEGSDEKIYQFTCKIAQQERHIFLSEKKSNRPSYIINSLMTIGCGINTDSESKRKEYVHKLWTMLMNEHRYDIWIPDRNGWYKDKKGKIKFWKEAYTWESLSGHTMNNPTANCEVPTPDLASLDNRLMRKKLQEIKPGEIKIWSTEMLTGTSFLYFLLREYGHDLDSGIILISENDRRAWQIERAFIENLDARSIPRLRQKIEKPLNYQMGLHVYKRSDRIEAIIDFLHQKDFLPVLIVGGIVPDGLSENAYVMKYDATDTEIKNISRFYEGFRKYVLDNVEYVLEQLKNLKFEDIMDLYDIDREFEYFLRTSIAVGKIWKCYMRDIFDKHKDIKETEIDYKSALVFKIFVDSAAHAIELMGAYDSSYDIPGSVRDCLIGYIKEHGYGVMQDISQTTDKTDLDKMILYDEDFYYIKNKLFTDICSPLLETISTVQLKKYMQEAGILKCDNTAKGTYSPKVSLPSLTDGSSTVRHRFIKMFKDPLKTDEGLSLEDHFCVYGNNETNEADDKKTTEGSNGWIDGY